MSRLLRAVSAGEIAEKLEKYENPNFKGSIYRTAEVLKEGKNQQNLHFDQFQV